MRNSAREHHEFFLPLQAAEQYLLPHNPPQFLVLCPDQLQQTNSKTSSDDRSSSNKWIHIGICFKKTLFLILIKTRILSISEYENK
jgi:hypothetical protein